MDDKTLDYYNQHSSDFVADTRAVDFSIMQDEFLSYVKPHGRILDFGCGSGRDTKYFLERGYYVDAIDGSEEMRREASAYTRIKVKQMLFQDLHVTNLYDGIWACASILHVPGKELPVVFSRMRDALKPEGVIYASFKYGSFEGVRDGRYFTDLNEDGLSEIINEAGSLRIVKMWISNDVRRDKAAGKWINILLSRKEIS